MSELIDHLIGDFTCGKLDINILLLCTDRHDLFTLKRMVKGIIAVANVVSAPDAHVASALFDDDIDLAIIDADGDPEGTLEAAEAACSRDSSIPVLLLSSSPDVRERARASGACEVSSSPPPYQEFRRLLVRVLGRPPRHQRDLSTNFTRLQNGERSSARPSRQRRRRLRQHSPAGSASR